MLDQKKSLMEGLYFFIGQRRNILFIRYQTMKYIKYYKGNNTFFKSNLKL